MTVDIKFTILDRGAGRPELQVFVGFTAQAVKR